MLAARGCGGSECLDHVARSLAAVCVALAPLLARGQPGAPPPPPLPFAVGERLSYRVRVSAAGEIGTGTMWVEGPVHVRGNPVVLIRSRFSAKIAWLRAFSESDSWLDLTSMSALRFLKREKQPLSSASETVEIFPDEHRWTSSTGSSGETMNCAPLDELSFLYYIRTLPLTDSVMVSDRHYDPARNPVTIRVLRRQTLQIGKASFETVVVELRVRDAKRFKSAGVITLYLTDDARRIPVRIEAPAPIVGNAVFTLETIEHQ